jgi:hypothetical protein
LTHREKPVTNFALPHATCTAYSESDTSSIATSSNNSRLVGGGGGARGSGGGGGGSGGGDMDVSDDFDF